MAEQSLRSRAEELMVAVDHDLQVVETGPADIQNVVNAKADAIMKIIYNAVSDVDLEAAKTRAEELKNKHPDKTLQELAQQIIQEKCRQTGTVGAVTSGAGLIPGIGTAAAITLGTAADIGVTFKLQAELVLEIAALYDYPLSDEEKQRLVMVITGISAGTSVLARRAGQTMAVKAGERFAGHAILKAIPIVGVLASAGTNVLSTYIIGYRADTYFRLGPEAVGSWADSLRAVSGVDERRIKRWLVDSSKSTGEAFASGAGKVGEAGKSAGLIMAAQAGRAVGTASYGAGVAKETAIKGLRAYVRLVRGFWLAVFKGVRLLFYLLWTIVTFIPRRLGRRGRQETR